MVDEDVSNQQESSVTQLRTVINHNIFIPHRDNIPALVNILLLRIGPKSI